MLSAPLYLSTDLGNGCWDTRALLQGNEGVHCLVGSECVLLGHLRPTVEWGTQRCKALFETPCIIKNSQILTFTTVKVSNFMYAFLMRDQRSTTMNKDRAFVILSIFRSRTSCHYYSHGYVSYASVIATKYVVLKHSKNTYTSANIGTSVLCGQSCIYVAPLLTLPN